MNKKNMYIGVGLGALACGAAAMMLKPHKKHKMKSSVGKALKTMGDVAESISDTMGW